MHRRKWQYSTQTIWRPENDPTLTGLAVNSRLTLTVDGKGKINLVENIPQAIATPKTDNKASYQGMNNETKKQVASYVTEMANLFNFCLKQVDMTVEPTFRTFQSTFEQFYNPYSVRVSTIFVF